MHRSGTSAITRALPVLGVDLGNRLMEAHPVFNERGFWEDLDIYELNAAMLRSVGSEWYRATPLGADDFESLERGDFGLRAIQALRAKVSGTGLFGFKDPRLCQLLPFWKTIFQHDDFDTRYVVAMRNPISVVASLEQRDGMARGHGYLLWLTHTLGSLIASVGSKRVFVDFDFLMRDPRRQIETMAQALGLTVDEAALEVYAREFLSDALRHTVFRPEDVDLDPECPAIVRACFRALSRVADGELDPEGDDFAAKLDGWVGDMRALEPAMRVADALQQQNIELRGLVDIQQPRLATLSAALAERDDALDALRGQLSQIRADTESRLAEFEAASKRHESELDAARTALGQQARRADGLAREAAEARAAWKAGEAAAAWALDQEIAAWKQRLHDREVELIAERDRVLMSSTWRATWPLRRLLENHPGLSRFARKGAKLTWWTATGQIPRRIREFRQIRRREAEADPPAPIVEIDRPLCVAPIEETAPKFHEVARPIDQDFSVAVPFLEIGRFSGDRPTLAVICHMFHENLASEFRRYFDNIPVPFDVFISTDTYAKKDIIAAVFRDWQHAPVEIRVVANRGRDIAPKLVEFRDLYSTYQLTLHLHSKISTHASVLANWRGFLLENMIGSPEIVSSIIEAFIGNPRLGLIASQHFEPVRHWLNWGNNFRRARELCARMGIDLKERAALDFPSGSMFWVRSAALTPFLEAGFTLDDFEEENGLVDGTTAHAIERLFFLICEKAGFDWIKIARPELFAHTPGIMTMRSATDLGRFIDSHGVRLTGDEAPSPRTLPIDPVNAPAPALLSIRDARALGSNLPIDSSSSVVIGIVTHNPEPASLRRAVGSARVALETAALAHAGRIIILDNGASTEQLFQGEAAVRYIPPVDNVGFGAGHNRLMAEARKMGCDFYLCVNPDGILHPKLIAAQLRMMHANHCRALIEARQFPAEHPKIYDPFTFETAWVSGACLMLPRAAIDELAGFDEAFFMYCEDVDLSWRAKAAGLSLRLCPEALFLHEVTNRPRDPNIVRLTLDSAVVLARKWRAPEFENQVVRELAALGFDAPSTMPAAVPHEWRRFSDFAHSFGFAEMRW